MTRSDDSLVRQTADRLNVAEVLSRYTYGWDTRDFDLVEACFTPDAVISYSSLPEFPGGFPEFFTLERNTILKLQATQHFVGNVTVTVRGDEASMSSYVQATHYHADGRAWTTGGRYDDELVRAGDGWRIRKRHFTRQYIRDDDGLSKEFLAN